MRPLKRAGKTLKLLFVFNKGKSVIFSTMKGDVYALGLNPSGVLGILDKIRAVRAIHQLGSARSNKVA